MLPAWFVFLLLALAAVWAPYTESYELRVGLAGLCLMLAWLNFYFGKRR